MSEYDTEHVKNIVLLGHAKFNMRFDSYVPMSNEQEKKLVEDYKRNDTEVFA